MNIDRAYFKAFQCVLATNRVGLTDIDISPEYSLGEIAWQLVRAYKVKGDTWADILKEEMSKLPLAWFNDPEYKYPYRKNIYGHLYVQPEYEYVAPKRDGSYKTNRELPIGTCPGFGKFNASRRACKDCGTKQTSCKAYTLVAREEHRKARTRKWRRESYYAETNRPVPYRTCLGSKSNQPEGIWDDMIVNGATMDELIVAALSQFSTEREDSLRARIHKYIETLLNVRGVSLTITYKNGRSPHIYSETKAAPYKEGGVGHLTLIEMRTPEWIVSPLSRVWRASKKKYPVKILRRKEKRKKTVVM